MNKFSNPEALEVALQQLRPVARAYIRQCALEQGHVVTNEEFENVENLFVKGAELGCAITLRAMDRAIELTKQEYGNFDTPTEGEHPSED